MARLAMIVTCVLFISVVVQAGDMAYKCNAAQRFVVTDQGRLEQVQLGPFPIKFEVDRDSGKFDFLMGNINLGLGESRVIDRGSSGHSFKVIWEEETMTGQSVGYLQVHEYIDSPVKPFIAVDHTQVLSGTCE